ncbi:DUF4097 family beta strand repeat protein [bacterium]|nr:DUF4097 family beta strand repeat protein [bacterium]
MNDERMKVLTMLEEGKITAAEAATLLTALGKSEPTAQAPSTPATEAQAPQAPLSLAHQMAPAFEQVNKVLDRLPEQIATEHLPKVGKGVSRVVDVLSGLLNQGLGMIESHLQPTHTFEQTLAFSETADLVGFDVQNTHGTIRLIGEDREDVAIKVVAHIPGATYEAAQSFFAEHPVTLRREGAQLRLTPPTSLSQSHPIGALMMRHRYDFECRLPRHLVPQAASISGDLHADDLRYGGHGHLKTVSGDIQVQGIEGNLSLNTVSGELTATDCAGHMDARAISGDVILRKAWLSGSASTVSGSIDLDGKLSGDLKLKSISGDIEAEVEAAFAMSASTTSGNIDVRLASGSSGYVDASTRSGDLEMKQDLTETIFAKRHIKGKLNNGTAALTYSTISGDVTIR